MDKLTLEDIDNVKKEAIRQLEPSEENMRKLIEDFAALNGRVVTSLEITMLVQRAMYMMETWNDNRKNQ